MELLVFFKFSPFLPNSMLERLSPSFSNSHMSFLQQWNWEEGLTNKKSIKLFIFDEILNIMCKIVCGCFLYWIKIVDNMSEKTADIWTITPPRQFSILISDLAETFKSSVVIEQMLVVRGTPCLLINSVTALTEYIFETIADLSNIFIQQLI